MDTTSQQPQRQDGTLLALNAGIEAMCLAKKISSITPATVAFESVGLLLTMIRDSMDNEMEYVELGLSCADVCRVLDRAMEGRRLNEVSQSVIGAIEQLTATVSEIQRKIVKQNKRNGAIRLFHAKRDKETIAAWKSDLNRALQIFNTELAIITNLMVADIHRRTRRSRFVRLLLVVVSLGIRKPTT